MLLLKGAAAVIALVAGPLAFRALTKPGFLYTASVPPEELVGKVAVTDVNVVTATFGRAFLVLDARDHVLQIRSKDGREITPRGTRVLLESFDPEKGYFLVSRVEED